MNISKHFTILIITTLLVVLSARESNAFHITGSNIQFECIGNDSFKVKWALQMDCYISMPSSSVTLYWTGLDSNCSSSATLYKTESRDVTPVCSSQCTSCSNNCSYTYGLEEYVYEAIIDLSVDQCKEYHFYAFYCCMAYNSDNIEYNSQHHRTDAYLNTGVSGCPSTPRITSDKSLYNVCKDTEVIYDPGYTASATDSLVFSMVTPVSGGGSNANEVVYLSGYSNNEPLDYLGKDSVSDPTTLQFPYGFHLDKSNGLLKFVPTSEMMAIMGIGASQYRNDTLISKTMQTFQVDVLNCPTNAPPKLSADTSEFVICADSSLTFEVYLSDPDSFPPGQDSVFISSAMPLSLSNAQFEPDSGIVYTSSKFSWTPSNEDSGSHTFFVHGHDNACPVPGQVAKPFTINVIPMPTANIHKKYLGCGQAALNAELTNFSPSSTSFTWEGAGGLNAIGDSVLHIYNEPGIYPFTVTLEYSNCHKKVYHDTVIVPEDMTIDAGDDILVCENEPFSITPLATGETNHVDFHWSTGDSNVASKTFAFDENTEIIVTAVYESGCTGYDTVNVEIVNYIDLQLFSDITICGDSTVLISSGYSATHNHVWTNLDENIVISNDTSILVNNSGTFALEVTDTVTQKCIGYDTTTISFHPEPKASFSTNFQCNTFPTSFTNTSAIDYGDIVTFEWDIANEVTSYAEDTLHIFTEPGIYPVTLKVTSDASCADDTTIEIEIFETPVPDFSLISTCTSDLNSFNNETAYSDSSENLSYHWDFGYNGITSTVVEPEFDYTEKGIYQIKLRAESAKGCADSVIKNIEIYESPKASFAISDTCVGNEVVIRNYSEGNNFITLWSFGDGNESNLFEPEYAYSNSGTFQVNLMVVDNQGCSDQHQESVQITNKPNAGFSYDKSVGRVSFKPYDLLYPVYKWDFGDGNSSTDLEPIHFYDKNGTYNVSLMVENYRGCFSQNTVNLTISNVSLESNEDKGMLDAKIHPNPFSGETVITYELPENADVHIALYDLTGRKVTLIDRAYKTAGEHSAVLNAQDAGIASGVYILRLQAGDGQAIKRIVNTE